MLVGGRHDAVAFQADEPQYPTAQLELVCDVRLRDALGLADGDPVELIVLPRPREGERWIAGAVIHDGSGRIFMQRRSPERSLSPARGTSWAGTWSAASGSWMPCGAR